MLKIKEGDTYILKMPITINKELVNINDIDIIEFTFENVSKFYGTYNDGQQEIVGDVTYDDENKLFLIPLSQEETFSLANNSYIAYEGRIKFKDGKVKSSKTYVGTLCPTISKKVL